MRALDQMGAAVQEQGVDLAEWIEPGRQVRRRRLQQLYGIDPAELGQ